MTPTELDSLADAVLVRIAQALDESGADCDCETKGEGVLELEFSDGGRIVVNCHSAAQEVWVAAKSGGYHFRGSDSDWVDTREAGDLFVEIAKLVRNKDGSPEARRCG